MQVDIDGSVPFVSMFVLQKGKVVGTLSKISYSQTRFIENIKGELIFETRLGKPCTGEIYDEIKIRFTMKEGEKTVSLRTIRLLEDSDAWQGETFRFLASELIPVQ